MYMYIAQSSSAQTYTHTVETGVLAHALMGSIADLYAYIRESEQLRKQATQLIIIL